MSQPRHSRADHPARKKRRWSHWYSRGILLTMAAWSYLSARAQYERGIYFWHNGHGFSVYYAQVYAAAVALVFVALMPWDWILRRMVESLRLKRAGMPHPQYARHHHPEGNTSEK